MRGTGTADDSTGATTYRFAGFFWVLSTLEASKPRVTPTPALRLRVLSGLSAVLPAHYQTLHGPAAGDRRPASGERLERAGM